MRWLGRRGERIRTDGHTGSWAVWSRKKRRREAETDGRTVNQWLLGPGWSENVVGVEN